MTDEEEEATPGSMDSTTSQAIKDEDQKPSITVDPSVVQISASNAEVGMLLFIIIIIARLRLEHWHASSTRP